MRKFSLAAVLAGSILCSLAACSATPDREATAIESGAVDVNRDPSTGTGTDAGAAPADAPVPAAPVGTSDDPGCKQMDILFVIDNSGSMSEEQTNLTANFPKFIEILNTFRDGTLDYRVGVTTTSFRAEILGVPLGNAAEGALLKGDAMVRPWLERSDANVIETFTDLASVGLGGSGNEQPLRASQAALTERVVDGSNAGFLRDDALLAIIILTDEDDASEGQSSGGIAPGPAPSVTDFVAAFDSVKGERARWATAVIAGDEAPTCNSQFGDAKYATRLLDFVQQTGKNAVFSSICDGDLSKALDEALDTFSIACDDFVLI